MKKILLFLIIVAHSVIGQTVYQSHEVEKAAEPTGGADILNFFISSNLQIPVKPSWSGLSGQVFVTAVIETDGSASDLKVTRGIDTICNSEAIRVLNLYKMWKPAQLDNKPVRQAVIIPVTFKSKPALGYDITQKCLQVYYNKRREVTTKTSEYKYRRCIPVDDFGFLNGDVLYQQKNDNDWSNISSVPFKKEQIWYKLGEYGKEDSVRAVKISAAHQQLSNPVYQVVVRQMNDKILSYNEYDDQGRQFIHKEYFLNGILKASRIKDQNTEYHMSWYDNGQLANVVESPVMYKKPFVYVIKEAFDANGNHLIKNGNGYFGPGTQSQQGLDGYGTVKDGFKEGLWIMKSKDSTLLFEELYNKGVLTKGVSFFDGERREYTEAEVQPEFSGGIASMYRYLGKNTEYPKDAAKQNIMGSVITSFVVCEDGTLCDFKVIRGVYPSIDKEALRVVEGMSGKWQPGWQRGRKVKVKYNLPINFTLQ